MTALRAPFQWFGGKAFVAADVWAALGDVQHYVEPFLGSAAVLLARPAWHTGRVETVNDRDGFVANFWRAVQRDPDGVAAAADWPVNEVDLEARHRWLCRMSEKAEFLERIGHDPEYFDAQRAGWWCWGLAAWIGSGWCGGEYWPGEPGQSHGDGVCDGANKRPSISRDRGIHRKLPHLGNAGQGIHRRLPECGDSTAGECARRREVIRGWIGALADRLRNVRVCCGDWARICTDGATAHGSTVGIFLDPPYSHDAGDRDTSIYREESADVAHRCREYCLSRTGNHRYRVVLAGYDGEHNELEAHGWRVAEWKTNGGMANFGKQQQRGKDNARRERLWLSPSCLSGGGTLFEATQ